MTAMQELAQRVQLLEKDIDEIRKHLNLPRQPWWERIEPIPEEFQEDFRKAMEEARRELNVADWPLEAADEDWTE